MLLRKVLFALALLPAAWLPQQAQALPRYAITELPSTFMPNDINNSGEIVGSVQIESGATLAALYAGGLLTEIGGFGGSYSVARAINEHGLITGVSETAEGGLHAFLYNRQGILTDIGAGFAGSTNAFSINNKGQVVGQARTEDGPRAFLYSQGQYTILPVLGTGTTAGAWDINDKGTIVGDSSLNPELHAPFHPFAYRNGNITDLGSLEGWENNAATVINNAGRIAGYSTALDGSLHAFVYEGSVLTGLGSFGGRWLNVADINERGAFVGGADTQGSDSVGFIYLNGALVDLNTLIDPASGWHVNDAYGINDLGQIVGRACRNFECSTVRLDLVSAVPEPAMALMLLPGVLALAGMRRRQLGRGRGKA